MNRNGDDLKNVPFVQLGGGAGGGATVENFDIEGIKIKAFYDAAHRLLFVLDLTRDEILPNALLVVREREGRKWDDILANDFGIDPETVRPRADNKYQKLDIDYDALDDYNDAILSGGAGNLGRARLVISENQRDIRTSEAEREMSLARETAREAKKTISDLDDFIRLQKEKLGAAKKNVGREPPKDSAAKILRYEARIERAGAKKARSLRRLRRAEKRIDSAAELFNNYRNNLPTREREMNDDNQVRPLFTENPNIMDTENAFKPVSFSGDDGTPAPAPVMPLQRPVPEPAPAARPATMRPVAPMSGTDVKIQSPERPRQGGAYYFMLMLLIGLSIFTLYLYQKKMNSDTLPHIAALASKEAPVSMDEPESEPEPERPSEPAAEQPAAAMPEPAPEPAAEQIPETLPETIPTEDANPFIETESAPAAEPEPTPMPAAEPEIAGPEAIGPETFEPAVTMPEPVPEPAVGEPEVYEEYEQVDDFAEPDVGAGVDLEYEADETAEYERDDAAPDAEENAFMVSE